MKLYSTENSEEPVAGFPTYQSGVSGRSSRQIGCSIVAKD
jgi:hypothetical protein